MREVVDGKKILITGGAGFIGNEVARQLVAAGALVTVVDNLVNGKWQNIADLPSDRLVFDKIDIRDLDSMGRIVRGQDCILHLACLGVRHSIHAPLENHAVNATGTLQLLELARQNSVGRFVYVSSSEIYGTAQTAPMTEQHPAWPMTVYGAAKLAGERYADAFWRTYRYPVTVIRPFNAFGPRSHHEGDSGEVIPKFMLRALCGRPLLIHGDGKQTRDFTFVADTARGIIEGSFSPRTIGLTLNLGSGAEISVGDLATLVLQVTGSNDSHVEYGPDRPGDVRRLIADTTLARDAFGYVPQVGLEDGLRRLLAWYQSLNTPPAALLTEETPINWTTS